MSSSYRYSNYRRSNLQLLIEQGLWKIIDDNKKIYYHCDSRLLNIKTTIGSYTNKKNKTSLVHYTDNNKYFGSVEKLGDSPIYYEGNFIVTPKNFIICS